MNVLIRFESGLYEVVFIPHNKLNKMNTTTRYSFGKEFFKLIQKGIITPSK